MCACHAPKRLEIYSCKITALLMPNRFSLLAGRNTAPLTPDDIRRSLNVILGLDNEVPVRYEAGTRTIFKVPANEPDVDCEIVFSEDIYPGKGVADPNSSLSMVAAAAHEVTHYHRWKDKSEINDDGLMEVDEALTSLQAILRFPRDLGSHDIRLLVADAIQRLQMYVHRIGGD